MLAHRQTVIKKLFRFKIGCGCIASSCEIKPHVRDGMKLKNPFFFVYYNISISQTGTADRSGWNTIKTKNLLKLFIGNVWPVFVNNAWNNVNELKYLCVFYTDWFMTKVFQFTNNNVMIFSSHRRLKSSYTYKDGK